MSHEGMPTMEKQEGKIEKRTLLLEGGSAEVAVETLPDGSMRFAEDLRAEDLGSMMDVSDLEVFTNAGIELKREIASDDMDTYDLADGEGNSGWLDIRKDSLNRAIEEGRLKLSIDEDGDLKIE